MTQDSTGSWQVLNTKNSGLAADRVTAIVEDGSGALWFSSYGGGLARLGNDGRTWTSWRTGESGLVNDFVGALALDPSGRVWSVCDARQIGDAKHAGGICVLAPDGAWQVYPRSADEDCILCMDVDRVGTLWLRTGGLYVGERLTQCDGARDGTERFLGYRWLAFDGNAWSSYDGDRAAMAAWWPHRSPRPTLGWVPAGDKVWWLERVDHPMPSFQGLGALMGGLAQAGSLPSFAMISGLGSFTSDYNLVSYDGVEFCTVSGIPSPFRFGELVLDARGHAWVSLVMLGDMVLSRGVARWDGTNWTCFDRASGLMWDSIVSLTTDSRGAVWCAHMLGDVSHWDGQRWSHLPAGQGGRPSEDLGRATEDRRGRLWFPSKAGAVVYTP